MAVFLEAAWLVTLGMWPHEGAWLMGPAEGGTCGNVWRGCLDQEQCRRMSLRKRSGNSGNGR
jgi:hypothetical protein